MEAETDKPPLCITCGRKLKQFQFKDNQAVCSEIVTGDGAPPAWGPYGDNVACSLECINITFGRILASVPGVLDLLPPDWRKDRAEQPNNDQQAAKLKRTALKVAKQHAARPRKRWIL